MGQGALLAVIGICIGLALAFAVKRLISNLLFDVSATDPWTFALTSLLILAVALAASLIPALRAIKVDPVVALRYE
jgi:putative ABC transport system permease protein